MLELKLRYYRLTGCLITLLACAPFAQPHNTLGLAETQAGYDLLFNGSDLDNWHAYRKSEVTDAWTVKTDTPLGPRIENGNGDKVSILTDKTYKNFDLKVDVRLPISGDGGIFTRFEEIAPSVSYRASGPMFKLCGPYHVDCLGLLNTFGACYDMFPVRDSLRTTWYDPPGTWNQIRIIAYDSNYVHYGNGKKLLEYKIGTLEFQQAYDMSKYFSDGNNGRYYDIHSGGFMLLHHGATGNAFRNVKAKELKIHPFLREFPDGKWPDRLPQDFVFADPSVATVPVGSPSPRGFSSRPGGPGETLVAFPSRPSNLRAEGLDGRAADLRELGAGFYVLHRRQAAPEVLVLRYRIGGKPKAELVVLQ